jgi:hypothetical protein
MLFLESNCTGLPATLIEDSVLKPVDKLIWLLMMMAASRGGGQTFLPTQPELAKLANVGVRHTVSRSLTILRCRRWLTVCYTSWRKGGSQEGSAYALHSRPLKVADTIFLDPNYPAFLEKTIDHGHTRVQLAACEALGQVT